jgi:hypothetical protein
MTFAVKWLGTKEISNISREKDEFDGMANGKQNVAERKLHSENSAGLFLGCNEHGFSLRDHGSSRLHVRFNKCSRHYVVYFPTPRKLMMNNHNSVCA